MFEKIVESWKELAGIYKAQWGWCKKHWKGYLIATILSSFAVYKWFTYKKEHDYSYMYKDNLMNVRASDVYKKMMEER